jgi:flavin reductase (DIM6/NTAB) family NADH-FMN oxidoreductase RutF
MAEPIIDSREFRDTLGRFATGVTIITAREETGEYRGLTANSFSSLSLDPPLVLWSLGKSSQSHEAFCNSGNFAINVLAADQRELCKQFTRKDIDRFQGVELIEGVTGAPLIPGSLAWFECTLEHAYDGGDHTILVGRVVRFAPGEGAPLIFYKGDFWDSDGD